MFQKTPAQSCEKKKKKTLALCVCGGILELNF